MADFQNNDRVLCSRNSSLFGFACKFGSYFLISMMIAASLSAQTEVSSDPPQGLAANISQALQEQARALLDRHLPPGEVQVFVRATPKATQEASMPYLPYLSATSSLSTLDSESLVSLTQKIELEILLSSRFMKVRDDVQSLLIKAFGLDLKRGDSLKFTVLKFPLDPPQVELQKLLAEADLDRRELRAKLEAVTSDKGTLSQVNTKLAQENETLKKPTAKNFWQELAPVLVMGTTILIGLLALAWVLRGASVVLGQAVTSVGNNLTLFGDKIRDFSAMGPGFSDPAPMLRADNQRLEATPLAEAAALHLPLESVAKRILELRTEILEGINLRQETLLVEHLSSLLAEDSTVNQAVATMELLGTAKANELFEKLTALQQQKVTYFLKKGTHTRPKGEVMLEVGEVLKTKLFGASLSSRRKLDDTIKRNVSLLKPADVLAVVPQLSEEQFARLCLYFEPVQLSESLDFIHAAEPELFSSVATMILKMPEVENQWALDQKIAIIVESQVTKLQADLQLPYLPYYRTLVEGLDEQVGEALMQQMQTANAHVGSYLHEHLVTFSTFFRLQKDIQSDLVRSLSNRDLAAVMIGLSPQQKAEVSTFLEQRRLELLNEELDRLTAKGERQVNIAHRAAKKHIVAHILQLKGSGSLGELLLSSTQGTTAQPSVKKTKMPAA